MTETAPSSTLPPRTITPSFASISTRADRVPASTARPTSVTVLSWMFRVTPANAGRSYSGRAFTTEPPAPVSEGKSLISTPYSMASSTEREWSTWDPARASLSMSV